MVTWRNSQAEVIQSRGDRSVESHKCLYHYRALDDDDDDGFHLEEKIY